jgi:Protein of unknown function (DUF1638)
MRGSPPKQPVGSSTNDVPRPDAPSRRSRGSRRPQSERPAFLLTDDHRDPGSLGTLSRRLERSASQKAEARAESGYSGAADRPYERPAFSGRSAQDRVLVVGCGALGRELVELTRTLPNVEIACLPPDLHNRPGGIPSAVRDRIRRGRAEGFEHVFVAYADCGTGGLLDRVLAEEGVERLPGAHCYEFFAGRTNFSALADEEPATFWLTDFLARNFERLVIRGLGIDRHPELEAVYFGNYRRVVYLSQTDDPDLLVLARAAAARLGLTFEHRHTGYGELADYVAAAAATPLSPPVGAA